MQTRRGLLRQAAAASLATAWPGPVPGRAAARPVTLRIAQWVHIVPAFDEWLDKKFAREWGERHGVAVEIDHVPAHELRARAATEVAGRHGHDVFAFLDSPADFADDALPLTDVVQECERRFGKLVSVGQRATWDPRKRVHFALAESWAPSVLHYRTDWWTAVGTRPDTWADLRKGARSIREKVGATAGFGLAPELDSNATLRGLLWGFGAAEQDEGGRVTINSPATVEAIRLMTAIFQESMTPDVLLWDGAANNRGFLWGRASVIENAVSAIRSMEKNNPELARKAALAPPAAGPRDRRTAAALVHSYVVWRFSPQAELAKRFLVDLVSAAEEAFRISEFHNCPAFPGTVRDLPKQLRAERPASGRYLLLAEAERWTAWPGHPGYATPAITEAVQRGVVPNMFARAARGEQSPEESARQAEAEMKRIVARWAR